MARRSVELKIQEPGRDQGKLFKITEMSAFDTEEWAERSINAILRNANKEDISFLIPLVYTYVQEATIESSYEKLMEKNDEGMVKIQQATEKLAVYLSSLFFSLPYDDLKIVVKPLFDCCSIYLNPGQNDLVEPILNNPNHYIEEVSTIIALKREAFKLHTDFFTRDAKRYLDLFIVSMEQLQSKKDIDTIQTSLNQSER